VEHRVVLAAGGDRCSCPWFNRTGGAAGPCKHVLAAQMARDAAAGKGKRP
jgi:predicted nucleic acid-binding Zn finger protein